jgi:hypothetical protein
MKGLHFYAELWKPYLIEFMKTLALDELRAQAAQSPWGVASNGRILDEPRLRSMKEMYLPD